MGKKKISSSHLVFLLLSGFLIISIAAARYKPTITITRTRKRVAGISVIINNSLKNRHGPY
jgi:hypothetical protein